MFQFQYLMLLGANNLNFLTKDERDTIGISYVMEKLEVFTPFGRDRKKNLTPYTKTSKDELLQEFSNIETLQKIQTQNAQKFTEMGYILHKIRDIRPILSQIISNQALTTIHLYELKYFALLIENFYKLSQDFINLLSNIKFESLRPIIDLLDPEHTNLPTFYIYNAYSSELQLIRQNKREIEAKIQITSEIEQVSRLKNDRLNIVIQEEQEELKIRRKLSNDLLQYHASILVNIQTIAYLDLLLGKIHLLHRFPGTKPTIVDGMELSLINAYHPLVQDILHREDKHFTPISINLQSGVSILTGANMGGKTVSLKTTVLNTYLAQMGFFVFADEAKIPLVDFIQFVSDDQQDIYAGLSTFGAEIIKINQVIENIQHQQGLIVMDEFARGTNPKEGRILVKTMCGYLHNFPSISLVSTHFDGIATKEMVHYQVIGLKNVDFNQLKTEIGLVDQSGRKSIDIIQKHMDFRLEPVSPAKKVSQDALNIAKLLGLPEEIIHTAQKEYETEPKS